MTFVSYAQNYEDVMLWRALKHVEKGFYIDVGAAWPEEHSVTKVFYDKGWRGINLEPNPTLFTTLENHRSRDINLQVAVGEFNGEMMINFIDNTGLSTLDESIAARHKDSGWDINSRVINVQSLSNICSSNVPIGQDIHFLKVDIEGSEKQALLGHNWLKYRPWIVLVEATLPMTQQESYHEWEPLLVGVDYVFVYADGLNRFYVAKEHSYLIDSFKYPPNFFDGFITIGRVQAEAMAYKAQEQVMKAEARADTAQEQVMKAEARADTAQEQVMQAEARAHQTLNSLQVKLDEINGIYNSISWRITAPLRWLMHQLRLLSDHGFKQRAKSAAKKVLQKTGISVVLRKFLSNLLKTFFLLFPENTNVNNFVKGLVRNSKIFRRLYYFSKFEIEDSKYQQLVMNCRAEKIYQDLMNLRKK